MDSLEWAGPDVAVKPRAAEGRELGALHRLLLEWTIAARESDETMNLPSAVLHALDDLEHALSLAAPVFLMPLRGGAQAAELGEILARLTTAQIACAAEMARARSAFLFQALRDVAGTGTR